MNANTPHNAQRGDSSFSLAFEDLSVALVSPDETRRAEAAESACDFCEFAAYLATPADQARLEQFQYDVIMVDIDGEFENALKLVEKLSSNRKTRVLVYSSDKSLEKVTRCMRAGARDFLVFPFEHDATIEALNRFSAPRAATCACRDSSGPSHSHANREPAWRPVLPEAPMARSQAHA